MASRRADVLSAQLSGGPSGAAELSPAPTSARAHRQLPRFDVSLMERYLDPSHSLKEEVYAMFARHPELLVKEVEAMRKEEHRAYVRKCLEVMVAEGQRPLTLLVSDPAKYFYLGELLALVDLSLTIKTGVQYSLWGGSVVNLGTERHRREYFDAIDQLKLPGCFAMTELRHGSNVAELQTEAVLDTDTDEWVIHTPDDGAIKWWIGNAAEDGLAATVFARLKVPSADRSKTLDDHGVHAFIVPLRTAPGVLAPGVTIHDCGYKVGLNGVDNGSISFDRVRVPRGALLDRFATVDRAGRYSSPMPSATKRFAATLGELTGGRVGLTGSSVAILRGGLTIAIRYSAQRQQFGPGGAAPEVSVLDYPSQQLRLLPALATCYALGAAKDALAYTTSFTAATLNVCRECCGGHGYAAVNRLGALRSDHDIFQTFEGDNTVLLQQLAGTTPQGPRHLRDPKFLKRALRYRTARLLHTVAARLQKHSRRLGAFKAWNRCLLHLLDLSRAHVELVAYQALQAKVEACPDPDCRRSLKALADLFALDRIHADILFRNDDYLSPEKAKAIKRIVEQLCLELRGVAVPLVDAFGIPDHILRAPIGLTAVQHDPYGEYLSSVGWDV
ncbi:hypothetical protein QBZ16_002263 [Prototheca wickerhamii]|uniref:Acyl-coenzyme A oxidase n=1 Tax=Prototheca wickerhamii TaxID=3111 RepID=A0AAD9IKB1_PROWI|nr:hypothetical protein QBZ16_002263 [Prototheca wickerhamii]